jgi:NTE family protein
VPLLKAMFSAATEAWDREQMEHVVSARTVSIPTHSISTTDFGLSKQQADDLYGWGKSAASTFFSDPNQRQYLNSFGKPVDTIVRRREPALH